jgi:hypothetical protein
MGIGDGVFGSSMLGILCLVGCAPKVRLVDIPEPALNLNIPESGGTAVVMVFSAKAPFGHGRPCKLPAPDAKATLNGVPLERRRGEYRSDDFGYDRDCIVELGVPAAAIRRTGPSVTLRLSDASTTWQLEVPTAFSPRSFTLVTPHDGVLRRGTRVVVKWSTPSDQIYVNGIGFELYRADLGPGSGTQVRDIDVRGEELSFTLRPSSGDAAWAGPAFLRLLGPNHIDPAVTRCPVQTCNVGVHYVVPPVAVTVRE